MSRSAYVRDRDLEVGDVFKMNQADPQHKVYLVTSAQGETMEYMSPAGQQGFRPTDGTSVYRVPAVRFEQAESTLKLMKGMRLPSEPRLPTEHQL